MVVNRFSVHKERKTMYQLIVIEIDVVVDGQQLKANSSNHIALFVWLTLYSLEDQLLAVQLSLSNL